MSSFPAICAAPYPKWRVLNVGVPGGVQGRQSQGRRIRHYPSVMERFENVASAILGVDPGTPAFDTSHLRSEHAQ